MQNNNYILLINRDREVLEATHGALCKAGYLVLKALDTDDALYLLNAIRVGLIICDNALQGTCGREFLTMLKKDPLLMNIPFAFFVPVNDQGRSAEAFAIGASDFIVYPLDEKILIERISEIMPFGDEIQYHTTPQNIEETLSPQLSETFTAEQDERRVSERLSPLSPIRIEVSRDGALWMPGELKNISQQGIFAETSLLGKPGAALHIKFLSSDQTWVLRGFIKHITFSNPQNPAGIGIEIEETQEWPEVHERLATQMSSEDLVKDDEKHLQTNISMQDTEGTVVLPYQIKNEQADSHSLNDEGMTSEKALNIRFYQSLVGKQLDNYKAVSFIGAGAMGGVFKGWDTALERAVALKVISYELSQQENFRDMFISEARTISQLNHQNIAQIYYIGNMDDILYFVMEFINGKTLADIIKEHQCLDMSRGLEYFITVCRTLDFVSKMNIIHRDIKPENIMINDKGILKVIDFGVAKIVNESTWESNPSEIVGSPLYISPDCIKGFTLDCRSDIYSLGATFYHAFSGFPPFEGKNAEDVLHKHLKADPLPLNKRNAMIPNSLSMIVERMMNKEPEKRYQNYGGIIDDLESLITVNTKFHEKQTPDTPRGSAVKKRFSFFRN